MTLEVATKHTPRSNNNLNNSLRPRTEVLLREKDKLHSSIRVTDDLIQQAAEAKENLHMQAATFQLIQNKIKLLVQRFPVVNRLMGKISTTKQKDMIVMACVIASLLIFTVFYVLNKP